MKKTYVIGDIHGCHVALDRLLEKIAPTPGTDTIITLGDMINRGPDSSKVLETLTHSTTP
jgi:predicted phosphodiesterase